MNLSIGIVIDVWHTHALAYYNNVMEWLSDGSNDRVW